MCYHVIVPRQSSRGTAFIEAMESYQSDILALYQIVASRAEMFQMWQLEVREEGLHA